MCQAPKTWLKNSLQVHCWRELMSHFFFKSSSSEVVFTVWVKPDTLVNTFISMDITSAPKIPVRLYIFFSPKIPTWTKAVYWWGKMFVRSQVAHPSTISWIHTKVKEKRNYYNIRFVETCQEIQAWLSAINNYHSEETMPALLCACSV